MANPLIGDLSEYARFVVMVVEKRMARPKVPADHGSNDQLANGPLQAKGPLQANSRLQLVRRQNH